MTYVNGAFVPYVSNNVHVVNTGNNSWAFPLANADFYLAHRGNTSDYFGEAEIASVRIYARALTAEEVAHNYEVDYGRFVADKTPIVAEVSYDITGATNGDVVATLTLNKK
jgi:hypothetical protein